MMSPIPPRLLLLVVLSLLAIGCGEAADAGATTDAAPMSVLPENVLVVHDTLLQAGPSLSGDLAAERDASLRAELAATVTTVSADVGQTVRAGQVLATLDDAGHVEQLRSARAGLSSAETAATIARRELERTRRLLAGGAVAERDVELAERAQWSAEAGLESARAAVAAAQQQLDRTRIRAPFAGIVAERGVSVGDVAQVGNVLFTVVDPSTMRLEATVPVQALTSLSVGDQVAFSVSGYEDRTFEGRIARISPAVDPGTRQVRVVVTIPNRGRALVGGLFARGRIATETRTGLAIPLAAVDLRAATPTVRRIRSGKVELVAVTLGLRDDVTEFVEITSGLAAGDSVLIRGGTSLASGTAVVVRKE